MQNPATTSELDAARAEAGQARQRAAKAQAELDAHKRQAAERAIEAAVRRGVISPRRIDLRSAWLDVCLKDERVIGLIDQIRGPSTLDSRRGDRAVVPPIEAAEAAPVAVPAYSFQEGVAQ